MKKLNAKQEMFCREYIKDLNATQAAIRAGYSENAACAIGTENLRKPNIADFIQKVMKEREESLRIDAEWVLREASKSYLFNAKTIIDKDGNEAMTNASAASKFLELTGKHVSVKAFEGGAETQQGESLSISFNVNEAVKDIRVTRGQ